MSIKINGKQYTLGNLLPGAYNACEATEVQTSKKFAVKSFNNVSKITKGKAEANIWKTLKNEAIADFVDSGTYKHKYYIISEKADQSLETYMADNRKISLAKVKIIIRDVLRGLDYLHRNNRKHGDICAKNIVLFNTDSINIRAKLIDFGNSKNPLNSYNRDISNVGSLLMNLLKKTDNGENPVFLYSMIKPQGSPTKIQTILDNAWFNSNDE